MDPPLIRQPNRKQRRHERKKQALDTIKSLQSNRDLLTISAREDDDRIQKRQRLSSELKTFDGVVPTQTAVKPKRLLVFDLNKVLIYRIPHSSQYIVRPYAEEFLGAMSTCFELAIWTSMSKSSAKRILRHLFNPNRVPLLFKWYQNRCITLERPAPVINGTEVDNDLQSECSERPDKPIFLKNLTQIWKEYPRFSAFDTVSTF